MANRKMTAGETAPKQINNQNSIEMRKNEMVATNAQANEMQMLTNLKEYLEERELYGNISDDTLEVNYGGLFTAEITTDGTTFNVQMFVLEQTGDNSYYFNTYNCDSFDEVYETLDLFDLQKIFR